MHKLNEEKSRLGARRCGGQERWIDRTAFPGFDGNQENWLDFSRLVKEIIKISNQAPVLKVAQLRSKLLDAAKKS